ncbi:hypothetical protein B7494_g7819 [Chlorociboria aeruginascens]|nr:hypothetical protein B7494_g7819 [Chlorociboria aeruginascens]
MSDVSNSSDTEEDQNQNPRRERLQDNGLAQNFEANDPENWALQLAQGSSSRSSDGVPRSQRLDSQQLNDEVDPIAQAAVADAEKKRQEITEEEIAASGIQTNVQVFRALIASLNGNDLETLKRECVQLRKRRVWAEHAQKRAGLEKKDFFEALSSFPELVLEIVKVMPPRDTVSLYAISRSFHETLNGHMSYAMRSTAMHSFPEAAKVYVYMLYKSLCIPDPLLASDPVPNDAVPHVPSLLWLQMVIHRGRTVRDILACMAREGHRMPKPMSLAIHKMWLIMDVSTTSLRVSLLKADGVFTDWDLYYMQMFFTKLDMRFNDPIDGPAARTLRRLFLGQQGLTPLSKLLKRTAYKTQIEVTKLQLRYRYTRPADLKNDPIFDIPAHEIGIGHLEGWGTGRAHLLRPDELVSREAVRRDMGLKHHLMNMMIWGYVDLKTGKNLKPTEGEMYMSDNDTKPLIPKLPKAEPKVDNGKGKGKSKYKAKDGEDQAQGGKGNGKAKYGGPTQGQDEKRRNGKGKGGAAQEAQGRDGKMPKDKGNGAQLSDGEVDGDIDEGVIMSLDDGDDAWETEEGGTDDEGRK